MFGSSRLGSINLNRYYSNNTHQKILASNKPTSTHYELSNHLGNVLTTVTGRKLGIDINNNGSGVDYYKPEVVQASDYYPFGSEMPGRTYKNPLFSGTNDYRFGFNGKELDKSGEFGSLTHYDYGFRIYNPSIGKFLSVDPLTKDYPYYTPYQFAGNMPISAVERDGKDYIIITWHSKIGNQGHCAMAVANYKSACINGVEKQIPDGTFSVYEVYPAAGTGNIDAYVNDVNRKDQGIVVKRPKSYTQEQIMNLTYGSENTKATGVVKFNSNADLDIANQAVLNSMVSSIEQGYQQIGQTGYYESVDKVLNGITYSLTDSKDNCTFSCASFVMKTAELLYSLNIGQPENIKTSGGKLPEAV